MTVDRRPLVQSGVPRVVGPAGPCHGPADLRVAIAITIRTNTYVRVGDRLVGVSRCRGAMGRRRSFHPTSFQFWAPWSLDGEAEAPFGRTARSDARDHRQRLPARLLAAPRRRRSPPAAISPRISSRHSSSACSRGARISWRRRLGTRWAGVGASLLVATTPVAIAHVLMPMSDVPATALWALAWVMALRPGVGAALAAGCAVAMAVLVRPNLAPLGLAIAFMLVAARWKSGDRTVVAAARPSAWRRRSAPPSCSGRRPRCTARPSRAAIAARKTSSGWSECRPTPSTIPHMLLDLHGWLVFAGLALVPFAFRLKPSRDGAATAVGRDRRRRSASC